MSVKPATDENRAAWTGTAAGWLDGPIPRNEEVAASDVMYLVGAVLCLDARIEAERTRAEEAEALLRRARTLIRRGGRLDLDIKAHLGLAARALEAERDRLREDRDRFEAEARKHQTFKHRYDRMLDGYERRTGIDREDVFEAPGPTATYPSGAKESDDE